MSAKILAAFPAILGGFIFLRFFYFSRFYIARTQGQRLFFYSASLGLIFAAFSISWIKLNIWPIEILRPYWRDLQYPPETSIAIAPFLLAMAFLALGNFAAFFCRWWSNSNEQTTNWADLILARRGRVGNEIESFLLIAAHDGKKVMVCLDDRKVYVGLLVNVINRSVDSDSWLAIFPDFSGTRHHKTLKVDFKTDYAPFTYHNLLQWRKALEQRSCNCPNCGDQAQEDLETLEALEDEIMKMQNRHPALKNSFDPTDWVKYLPTERIISIGPYDTDVDLFPDMEDDVDNNKQ